MKNFTAKTWKKIAKADRRDSMARRQAANYERFMQEKANVFQVTDGKAQAMFWTMN